MIIGIREDVTVFLAYILRRVSEHVAASQKLKKPTLVTHLALNAMHLGCFFMASGAMYHGWFNTLVYNLTPILELRRIP